MARTCARSSCARCAGPWPWSATTRSCSRRRSPRTSPMRGRTRRPPRSRTPPAGRQRLAIARALLADPRVLILDDATSSVDSSTERLIKLALDEAMSGRTTFIIAHRLSTIALADEIVVLDHGRVTDHGDHAELLET